MNAVEIEEAVSELAGAQFDAREFPFAFLEAFGNRPVTVQRLRAGSGNASDVASGVLQRNNIHMAVCAEGRVSETLAALRASPKTAANKVKFILATDGLTLEAEELVTGEPLACAFPEFADHFAFFLPLAGISTIKQIKENPVDIKATGRLNKLYIELLKDNPDWATAERRHDLNHFMARLIFCLFAEDTGIFLGSSLFSATVERMSDSQSINTHEVISELFRAMNTKIAERATSNFRPWADAMPYVNGGLFSGSPDCPRFSKIARSYLLRAAALNWQEINPDIFGSMIQAVADDDERGALGMHYTSVPNILKVLNPLFLDDLHQQLDAAGDNGRALLNLRKRMAKIRVFDPACGSGNFLVIAYKEMRAIEAEINRRRREPDLRSEIPKTNFRGIELRDFPAEIARLALIIAEYQCDVLYRGQQEALAEFLPLDAQNWITCGNALRLDWLSICPPTGVGVKHRAEDLFQTPLAQAEIDFDNEGGETYICGNPPYKGGTEQTNEQKSDMSSVLSSLTGNWKSLDYVCGWFAKTLFYCQYCEASAAFVSTNSICQGEQVGRLWPLLLDRGMRIVFAYTSFKWANLASYNAGVTVAIIGVTNQPRMADPVLFYTDKTGEILRKSVSNISPYLIPFDNIIVAPAARPISDVPAMINGSKPVDGGFLTMDAPAARLLLSDAPGADEYCRPFFGSDEFIKGKARFCLWISDSQEASASQIPPIAEKLRAVSDMRSKSDKPMTRADAKRPHRFQQLRQVGSERVIIVPSVSSEAREYLPIGLLPPGAIISNLAYGLLDAPLWSLAIIASRLHLMWIGTVCGKMKTDFRYSTTLGWNTFPVPQLTDKNRSDLTECATGILSAREAHFPATIADLYNPEKMPADLRHAHERNDETLERIYIGRTFRNDTERLEKLFELYTRMTASDAASGQKPGKIARTKVH
jgi:hypothetical protein